MKSYTGKGSLANQEKLPEADFVLAIAYCERQINREKRHTNVPPTNITTCRAPNQMKTKISTDMTMVP
jgi:hypothetical protein